ncbi:hypothetical protein C0J08_04300 [Marinomonas sp. CT5]|uniref:hypothetical protein n=1 Tax=Marinomonas sp. CT5 TaxID=2066133 RepID=UPI001839466D|nr:hypothetical protein [Marinomonas sp. CT5]NVK73338.1 hypothetical protein [Oceanospirillaceae bacterium]QUX94676.1 hypothetical protein C0J08_04300 [Marinomonas sp. CT5]
MNIREIVETQLTQASKEGKPVSGSANFALLMSLFNQPGPSIMDTPDELNFHQSHAITRPMQFSHEIGANPVANIALLKALSFEPLANGPAHEYDAVENLEQQINYRL